MNLYLWVILISIAIAVWIWALITINPREDDYKDQARAIKEWKERRRMRTNA